MKTIYAPGTADGLIDAAHTWAIANPSLAYLGAIVLTGILAWLVKDLI